MNPEDSAPPRIETRSIIGRGHGQYVPASSAEASARGATHVRVGRGMVSVAKLEKNRSKSKARNTESLAPSPTNRFDIDSPSSNPAGQNPGTNKKWYHMSILRPRRASLQPSIPTSPASSRGPQAARSDDDSQSFITAEVYQQDETNSMSPSTSSRRGTLHSDSNPASLSPWHTIPDLPNMVTAPSEASLGSLARDGTRTDEADEDGRILLEALVGPPHPLHTRPAPIEEEVEQQANDYLDSQAQSHNIPPRGPSTSPAFANQHSPVHVVRRLPALPSSAHSQGSASKPPEVIYAQRLDGTQDAFTYVLGTIPTSSRVNARGPPPPYFSQSAQAVPNQAQCQPSIAQDGQFVLGQDAGVLVMPPVAPLSIRQKDMQRPVSAAVRGRESLADSR